MFIFIILMTFFTISEIQSSNSEIQPLHKPPLLALNSHALDLKNLDTELKAHHMTIVDILNEFFEYNDVKFNQEELDHLNTRQDEIIGKCKALFLAKIENQKKIPSNKVKMINDIILSYRNEVKSIVNKELKQEVEAFAAKNKISLNLEQAVNLGRRERSE